MGTTGSERVLEIGHVLAALHFGEGVVLPSVLGHVRFLEPPGGGRRGGSWCVPAFL